MELVFGTRKVRSKLGRCRERLAGPFQHVFLAREGTLFEWVAKSGFLELNHCVKPRRRNLCQIKLSVLYYWLRFFFHKGVFTMENGDVHLCSGIFARWEGALTAICHLITPHTARQL